MKKLKNIFIVSRPELEGKWWHRLANVLIYGSTIIGFLGGLVFLESNTIDNLHVNSLTKELTLQQMEQNIDSMQVQKVPNDQIQKYVDLYSKNSEDNFILQPNKQSQLSFFTVFIDLLDIILVTLGWFIFWESIVYRIVIYIIYGKKRITS